MNTHRASSVTQLLNEVKEGDAESFKKLYGLVYDEMKKIAEFQRANWEGDFTINTTALVHETYEKLVKDPAKNWTNRKHFYRVAAKAMRQILFTYAEHKNAIKRGRDTQIILLDREDEAFNGVFDFSERRLLDILAMERAMQKLEAISPRETQVIEYRFYLGLNVQETGKLMDISTATVKRSWSFAKAWLYNELR